MSFAEFGRHIDYFNKYGRITPVRKYDFGSALLAWKIDQHTGSKTEITDYLRFGKIPEQEASVDDVLKAFGGVPR